MSEGSEPPYSLQELCADGKLHHLLHALQNEQVDEEDLNEAAHVAAFCGQASCLELVLAAGADVHSQNKHGDNLLLEAMHSNSMECIDILLKEGFDVNFSPSTSAPKPLFYAVGAMKDVTVVEKLLKKGANINETNNYNDTPLILACTLSIDSMIPLMLDSGADINAQGFEKYTALHRSIESWNQDISRTLLLKGADVSLRDESGQSPFLLACELGIAELVHLMIDMNLIYDYNAVNNDRKNALHCAASSGNKALVGPLMNAGVDAEAVDSDGNTPLFMAAQNGHEPFATELLTSQPNLDVNFQGDTGRTVLHLACVNGLGNLASELLKRSSLQLDTKDKDCDTALLLAAKLQKEKIFELLLSKEVDINAQDRNGLTPLHWHIIHNKHRGFCQLLEHGNINPDIPDNESNSPLVLAASLQRYDQVLRLVKRGADVNAVGKNKKTVLHWLCHSGEDEYLKLWLRYNCNVNACDQEGRTALHLAISRKRFLAVELLVASGADTQLADCQGMTPLHIATKIGFLDAVVILLSSGGADTNAKNNEGHTPILLAAEKGFKDIVKVLFAKSDITPDETSKKGLLWQCAYHGYKDIVEKMLLAGVDVNTGASALIPAVKKGHSEIAKILVQAGCDVNAVDEFHRTPLMWAALRGQIDIVELLVQDGKAKVGEQDSSSDTALTIAAWHGRPNVIEYLVPLSELGHCESEEGMDALHLAIARDDMQSVQVLLKAGASINSVDGSGNTALITASVHTSGKGVLEAILDCGQVIDIDAVGSKGRTVLHWCVGDSESAELVLSHHPTLNAIDDNGASPILLSIAHGQPSSAKLLIEAGCDLNLMHQDGRMPIHHSVIYGDASTTEEILSRGIDVNVQTADGRSPILLACIEGHLNVVEVLLAEDSSINDVYFSAVTPLSVAIDQGHYEVAEKLIAHGADPNLIGKEKFSPLVSCIFNDDVKGLKLLMKNGAQFEKSEHHQAHPLQVAGMKKRRCIADILMYSSCNLAVLQCVYRDLVIILGEDAMLTTLKATCTTPKMLKMLARKIVRQSLPLPLFSAIQNLRIPTVMANYLMMNDIDHFC